MLYMKLAETFLMDSFQMGGYLVKRWVRGCAAQIECFFSLSGLPMTPLLFENWFRYRSHFCKMHDFWWIFSFSLPIGCQKVLMHANLQGTDWFKKGPSKHKWFRHRSQICIFSGLVIGWWSKLRTTHPYPTQSWVPPRAFKQLSHNFWHKFCL